MGESDAVTARIWALHSSAASSEAQAAPQLTSSESLDLDHPPHWGRKVATLPGQSRSHVSEGKARRTAAAAEPWDRNTGRRQEGVNRAGRSIPLTIYEQ